MTATSNPVCSKGGVMRSDDQPSAAQQAHADSQRPGGGRKAEPVEFHEGHAAGEGYDAGEGDGRKIADGAIQERNDQQHSVDPAGIEASPRLVDGFRRFLIRRSTLEHVGGSWADYEDRLLKTRPKRRSRR